MRVWLTLMGALAGLVMPACGGEEAAQQPVTMCFAEETATVGLVRCEYDALSPCETEGWIALASYDSHRACVNDAERVLDVWTKTGNPYAAVSGPRP